MGQGRLDTERTDIGIFNAETDDIGILGDRPDDDRRGRCSGPVAELAALHPDAEQRRAGLPLGRPELPLHQRQRRARHRGPERRQRARPRRPERERLPLRRDLAADSVLRAGRRHHDRRPGPAATWKLYRIPIRQPDAEINTPDPPAGAAPPDHGRHAARRRRARHRRPLRAGAAPVRRLALDPPVGDADRWACPAPSASRTARSSPRSSPPRTRPTWATSRRRACVDDVRPSRRRPRVAGHPDQREVAPDHRPRPPARRARRGVPAVPGRPAEPADLPDAPGLDARPRPRLGGGRSPGVPQAGQRRPQLLPLPRPGAIHHLGAEFVDRPRDLAAAPGRGREPLAAAASRPRARPSAARRTPTRTWPATGPTRPRRRSRASTRPTSPRCRRCRPASTGWAETVTTAEAELWVDDIRLSDPVSPDRHRRLGGRAARASDVGSFSVAYVRQNGQFRQINQDPSYRSDGRRCSSAAICGSTASCRPSLGLAVPLTVAYARTGVNPELLTGTDLRGDALPGLRKPTRGARPYASPIRREQWPEELAYARAWSIRCRSARALTNGRAQTELSEATGQAYTVNLTYQLQLRRRGFRLPLGGMVRGLPKCLRESEVGQESRPGRSEPGADAGLVWSSGLDPRRVELYRLPVPGRPGRRRRASGRRWRSPISGGTRAGPHLAAARHAQPERRPRQHARPPGLSATRSPIGRLAYSERRFLLGIPVGVERDRTLTTSLALTPKLTSWLRPRFITQQQLRALPHAHQPRPGAGGRRQRRVHPAADPQQRPHQRARRGARPRRACSALIAGDSSGLGKALRRASGRSTSAPGSPGPPPTISRPSTRAWATSWRSAGSTAS